MARGKTIRGGGRNSRCWVCFGVKSAQVIPDSMPNVYVYPRCFFSHPPVQPRTTPFNHDHLCSPTPTLCLKLTVFPRLDWGWKYASASLLINIAFVLIHPQLSFDKWLHFSNASLTFATRVNLHLLPFAIERVNAIFGYFGHLMSRRTRWLLSCKLSIWTTRTRILMVEFFVKRHRIQGSVNANAHGICDIFGMSTWMYGSRTPITGL